MKRFALRILEWLINWLTRKPRKPKKITMIDLTVGMGKPGPRKKDGKLQGLILHVPVPEKKEEDEE